ncbi:phosphatase PAP2 family protein [Oceanibaculum sp.]|uniref:phosphatase PAP2 family protein n=1 Tax=Oceanibaculum sp. TaxID=1903597 RepID=UPI00258B4282|nr:phosphatase PAP2 family protein [Oceanibaculum sp.]MCH2395817.1 phosphatase PAP2 family protein [Oceanibaculum sp.]
MSLVPGWRIARGSGWEIQLLLGLLLILIAVPVWHRLDLALAELFHDSTANDWLMPKEGGLAHAVLYTGARRLLGIGGVTAALLLAWSGWRRGWSENHSRMALVILVLALTPLAANLLKQVTGVSCPAQDVLLGGNRFGVTIWDRLYALAPFEPSLRCWPAGHAAGGFGLFGLTLLAGASGWVAPLPRWLFYAPGMATGWTMGLYQMARGQHFLTHTLASMLIGLLIATCACRLYESQREKSFSAAKAEAAS